MFNQRTQKSNIWIIKKIDNSNNHAVKIRPWLFQLIFEKSDQSQQNQQMLWTMLWSAKSGSFIDQLQSFSKSASHTNQKYEITYTVDQSFIHYYEKIKTFNWFLKINKCGHETMNFEWNWSKRWSIWMKRVRELEQELKQTLKLKLNLIHELKIHFILVIWISDADQKFLNKRYLKELILMTENWNMYI